MDKKMSCLSELDTIMDCLRIEVVEIVGDLRRRQKHCFLIDLIVALIIPDSRSFPYMLGKTLHTE